MEKEIEALVRITSSASVLRPRDLIQAFGVRPDTVSKIITHLKDKGLVEREGNRVQLANTEVAESFKRLYYAHRATPFQTVLAYRRADLLSGLDQTPRSVEELSRETGLPKKTVYYYLKDFLHFGIVKKSKSERRALYSINYLFWGELKDFVTSLQEYQEKRFVPREALLIKSYPDSILFKSLMQLDATPTSFSVYGQYGIELALRDRYYTLPKRDLSVEGVFLHSLDSAADLSQKLFCILFYLRNKDKLEGVKHPMMKNLKAVLRGKDITGYPTLNDISDRSELYGIKL
jgi:predicted transcriptional regulator